MRCQLFVLGSLLLFSACKKSAGLADGFNGAWEYENASNMVAASNYLPPGNGNIMVLGKGGAYERWRHDTLLFRGSYYLQSRADCGSRQRKLFFTTSESAFHWDHIISLGGDLLTLSTPGCYADGGRVVFRRIK